MILLEIEVKDSLTHFQSMFHFHTPWEHHKTYSFFLFSGGIEVEHWLKMGCIYLHHYTSAPTQQVFLPYPFKNS